MRPETLCSEKLCLEKLRPDERLRPATWCLEKMFSDKLHIGCVLKSCELKSCVRLKNCVLKATSVASREAVS